MKYKYYVLLKGNNEYIATFFNVKQLYEVKQYFDAGVYIREFVVNEEDIIDIVCSCREKNYE
jgi:hypothetical protein